jgi:hypothetical protein
MARPVVALLFASSVAFASSVGFAQNAILTAPATLPVTFTKTISADHAKVGDPIEARTIQRVQLPEGGTIPSGTRVLGHVVSTNGFSYDKTPYAVQKPSTLSVHFDSIQVNGQAVPLNVTVRAIATPIATMGAETPQASDMDPLATKTLIGGDQLIPSQAEVRNMDGDVVAYNKRDGVYAHLIARGGCDGGNVEVSVAMFSASACGAYGFANTTLVQTGSAAQPSTLTLVSTHGSPEIWKHTTALLEVLPQQTASLGR